jgi:hypothetical protein
MFVDSLLTSRRQSIILMLWQKKRIFGCRPVISQSNNLFCLIEIIRRLPTYPVNLSVSLPTQLTCLSPYLPSLPVCLPTYPVNLSVSLPTHLTCLSPYLPSLPVCILTFSVNLSVSLPTQLTCLSPYLPTWLPVCLSTCRHSTPALIVMRGRNLPQG